MLKHLDLINFRNYEKYSLDFAKTTIIVGPNGAGKTNLLEAINLLSTGRSWRTNYDEEAIRWGSDFTKISAKIINTKNIFLEMIIQRKTLLDTREEKFINQSKKGKIVTCNQNKRRLTDFIGILPTVLFSPEGINLIDGPPSGRRKFLDILLCQIDKKYTLALLDLAKIIRGRNRLLYFLKTGKSKIEELAFWDEKLVILGTFIIKKRCQAIEKINQNLSQIYQEISGQKESLFLKYKSTVKIDDFLKTILAQRKREIDNTATLFGPHRDDVIFLLENKDIRTFGSRGEYRSAILGVKIAEVEFLALKKEERPLLLLDDIFSELDKDRRDHLGELFIDQQVIITTTDLNQIDKRLREKSKIIELKTKNADVNLPESSKVTT